MSTICACFDDEQDVQVQCGLCRHWSHPNHNGHSGLLDLAADALSRALYYCRQCQLSVQRTTRDFEVELGFCGVCLAHGERTERSLAVLYCRTCPYSSQHLCIAHYAELHQPPFLCGPPRFVLDSAEDEEDTPETSGPEVDGLVGEMDAGIAEDVEAAPKLEHFGPAKVFRPDPDKQHRLTDARPFASVLEMVLSNLFELEHGRFNQVIFDIFKHLLMTFDAIELRRDIENLTFADLKKARQRLDVATIYSLHQGKVAVLDPTEALRQAFLSPGLAPTQQNRAYPTIHPDQPRLSPADGDLLRWDPFINPLSVVEVHGQPMQCQQDIIYHIAGEEGQLHYGRALGYTIDAETEADLQLPLCSTERVRLTVAPYFALPGAPTDLAFCVDPRDYESLLVDSIDFWTKLNFGDFPSEVADRPWESIYTCNKSPVISGSHTMTHYVRLEPRQCSVVAPSSSVMHWCHELWHDGVATSGTTS